MTHDPLTNDTIAAIASGIGPCGIGVIRISGPEASAVADKVFNSRSGAAVSDFKSHTVHYGEMSHPATGEPIDSVLLTVFRGPASYTGEDVVEVSCHGGVVTLRRALEAVLAAGARLAGPGEFTRRAFLNGRLDLVQAEAVNDLIRAQTEQAQRLALRQLGGALSAEIARASERILSILAALEASIDFPDDVEEPDYYGIAADIEEIVAALDRLLATSDRGRIYREGIGLAIVGRPNVGKSSLLNALLRQTRAIVTPIPGTTRDVIEESINIHGIPVVAADTAGLRESPDEVEQIGIDMTERTMAAASIVLVVLDAAAGVTEEDREIVRRAGATALAVLNKTDLIPEENRADRLAQAEQEVAELEMVAVSALTGFGVEDLEDSIARKVLGGEIGPSEGTFVTNLRHKQALTSARDSLATALDTVRAAMPVDFLLVDLMAARVSLGEITGDTASDDVIDRIFQQFCIGK